MKTISAAEANRHFSQMLREVQKGSTYVVTSHGAPVAILASAEGELRTRARARIALLARLKTQPALDTGLWIREELYDDDIPADSGNQS